MATLYSYLDGELTLTGVSKISTTSTNVRPASKPSISSQS